MANTHETLASLFTDIADAIRAVNGDNSPIVADNFPDAISELANISSDAIEAVDAVFNEDGSVTETYESGKIVTTTFASENQVVETRVVNGVETIRTTTLSEDEDGNIIETIVEGDKTIVKKTIINEDGSIDEQIL